MAKFVPSDHVERLEYDFTEYGGPEGVIMEPTTGRVNGFFSDMKAMMNQVKDLQAVAKDFDIEEMSDEQMIEKMSQVDEAEAKASVFQKQTIENLAVLCGAERQEDGSVVGGAPSVDDLNLLPYRVLQAFSQWLMGEIRPKATTPGSRPSPQDRRTRTS